MTGRIGRAYRALNNDSKRLKLLSAVPIAAVASGALMLIGLALFSPDAQPGSPGGTTRPTTKDIAPEATAPDALEARSTEADRPEAEVTGAKTDLLGPVGPVHVLPELTPSRLAEALRRPVRLVATQADPPPLASLVETSLAPLAPRSPGTERLIELTLEALLRRQEKRYFDAVLSAAAQRGEIPLPEIMRAPDGAIDSRGLLVEIYVAAGLAD